MIILTFVVHKFMFEFTDWSMSDHFLAEHFEIKPLEKTPSKFGNRRICFLRDRRMVQELQSSLIQQHKLRFTDLPWYICSAVKFLTPVEKYIRVPQDGRRFLNFWARREDVARCFATEPHLQQFIETKTTIAWIKQARTDSRKFLSYRIASAAI